MENSIVRKCETTIRDLINHTVSNIDKDKLHKENRTFLSKITERLHFEKQTDWSVLTSCLDVIGDSELAIFEYHNLFELDRTTNRINANYLSLYGVLSAVYIQYTSILKLIDLFKIKNLKEIKKNIDKLDIIKLRHKVAAHPFDTSENGNKESYKIDRNSFQANGNFRLLNSNNDFFTFNVLNSYIFYKKEIIKILYDIIDKLMFYVFGNNKSEIYNKFHNRIVTLKANIN